MFPSSGSAPGCNGDSNNSGHRPAASPGACMPGGDVGYATPEKRKVEGRADTAAVAAKGGNLSQLSHGLAGRYRTMAPVPDALGGPAERVGDVARAPGARRARASRTRARRLASRARRLGRRRRVDRRCRPAARTGGTVPAGPAELAGPAPAEAGGG